MSHSSRGPDEQRDLQAVVGAQRGHLGQLVLGQQHGAAALGHPVDGDALGRGLLQHGPQHGRAFHAGDLDPEVGAVGEPGRAALRRGLHHDPAPGQRLDPGHPGSGLLAKGGLAGSCLTEGLLAAQGHHATSRTAGRGGTSSSSSAGQARPWAHRFRAHGFTARWPGAGRDRGDPLQAARRHQVGVLGLGPAGQARVPGHRLAVRHRRGVPARVPLGRRDLELALRVPDRPALVVTGPATRRTLPVVGLVQDGQHVAVAVRRHAGGQRVPLDPQHPVPQRGELRRGRPRRGEPGGGGVQPAAPRDHDRHRELPHRGACRHRMPEPADPVVAADDQHRRVCPARFQQLGHPALDVEVPLTRPPGRQRLLQRGRRVRAQLPQVLLLGGGQGEPQLDQLLGGVHAERRVPVGGQPARVRTGDVLCGPDERVRVVPGHGDQIGEAMPARLVLLTHPVGFHLGGHQGRPGGRRHHPDQVGLGGPVHRRGHRPRGPGHARRAGEHHPGHVLAGGQPALQPVPGGVRAGHAPGRMFGYTEQSFVM